jgi:hypothetical protein
MWFIMSLNLNRTDQIQPGKKTLVGKTGLIITGVQVKCQALNPSTGFPSKVQHTLSTPNPSTSPELLLKPKN